MVAFLKPPLFVDHLLIYQDRAPEDTDVHFLLIFADDDRWWWSSSLNDDDDDDDDGGGGGGGGLNQVVWVNWMEAMRFVSLSPGYPDNGHSHSSRRGQGRLQVRKLDCSIVPEWNHRRWRERERERERMESFIPTWLRASLSQPSSDRRLKFLNAPSTHIHAECRQWWWGCTEGASAKKQSQHSGFKIQGGAARGPLAYLLSETEFRGGISHYCTLDIILEKLKKLNWSGIGWQRGFASNWTLWSLHITSTFKFISFGGGQLVLIISA